MLGDLLGNIELANDELYLEQGVVENELRYISEAHDVDT